MPPPPADQTLDLFPERAERRLEPHAPLAERMRPRSLDDLVGHEALLGPGRPLPGDAQVVLIPGSKATRADLDALVEALLEITR